MNLNKEISIITSALEEISLPPNDLNQIKQKIENNNGENSIDILELDSLGSMELCIALELKHNVLISPEELFLCNKVSDLLKIIKNQTD